MRSMRKESIFLTICFAVSVFLLTPNARTESAQKLKSKEEQVREEMLQITKELGTTCTECHAVNDFKSSSKTSYQIGARHMKLVAAMKANGFDGKKDPEANCYMCHRGQLKAPAGAPNGK